MRVMMILFWLVVGTVIFTGSSVLALQEQAQQVEMENVDGTVKTVSPDNITIQEYDYATESYVDASFALAQDLQVVNAASLTEIKSGDFVSVDYETKEGKKIAKVITVESYMGQ